MIPRVAYLSATRGDRASADPVTAPEVSSPVGATTSTSIQDLMEQYLGRATQQAQALRQRRPGPAAWGNLKDTDAAAVGSAYGAGGFDAVKQIEGWYDLPSHVRTQILAGASGRSF